MESLVAMGRCVGIDEDRDGRKAEMNNTKIQHHTTINTDGSFYVGYNEFQKEMLCRTVYFIWVVVSTTVE